jgi:hypothetical protein
LYERRCLEHEISFTGVPHLYATTTTNVDCSIDELHCTFNSSLYKAFYAIDYLDFSNKT